MHYNFCKLHGKGKMFVVLNGMCIQKSIYYKYFGDITNARNDSANALYKKVYMTIRDTLYVYLTPTLLSSYLC